MSLPSGLRPRKYWSREPGFATGSKVGLGMKRWIFPQITSRLRPSTVARWIALFASLRSMWRVKASSAS